VIRTFLRPFVCSPYRLASTFFPESFVGYNLLVALTVLGKGLVMFRLLDRLQPGRPGFAFLAAALFAFYPAGIFIYRANMVAYQTAVLCCVVAAYCLVLHDERPRAAALVGMLAAQVLGLGIIETMLPIAFVTPILLVWRRGGLSRHVARLAALWWTLPAALTAYVGYALLTKAGVVSYQSGRIAVPAGNHGDALRDSFVHVVMHHFWIGFRRSLGQLIGLDGDVSLAHAATAFAAALIAGLVAWMLQRSSQSPRVEWSSRRWALILLTAIAATWVGYSPYFMTDLRFGNYRTFFFSTIGASIAVASLLELLSGGASAAFRIPRDGFLLVSGPAIIGLAMMYALTDLAAWDRYSRDEQALAVKIATRLPAVRSGTMIAVMETKDARFEHKYYVWFYQNALRLIYGDPGVHVTLCYRNVHPKDVERPTCEFTPGGVSVRNTYGLAKAIWPYDQTIVLMLQAGGGVKVLRRIPGRPAWSAAYAPEALFDPMAPLPRRLFTYLKYAPAQAPRRYPRAGPG